MASNVKQSGELAIAEKALPADYNQDFYSWLMEQAQHVRTGEWDAIDRDNLAEEIESLGREQFNKLESALRVLLIHFLKLDHHQARDRGVGCCQSKSNGLNLRTCSTITPASSPESRKRLREPIARLGSKLPGKLGWRKRLFPRLAAIDSRTLSLANSVCEVQPLGLWELRPRAAVAQQATISTGGAMIRKLKSGGYRLYSRKINPKTGQPRNLGTFKTRAAA